MMRCQELSPSPDGANSDSQAMPGRDTDDRGRCECQEEPPIINGGNGEKARGWRGASRFKNGGNGEGAEPCRTVTAARKKEGHLPVAEQCHALGQKRRGHDGCCGRPGVTQRGKREESRNERRAGIG